MAVGVLLATGRDADVFAIDDRRVLRRYRDGGDTTAEAELMTHLAACGYPVPVVYEADGPDLVMQRLHGPTMLHALAADGLDLDDAATALADLHRRLHQVPAPVGEKPDARVLHLDLHPDNVVLTADGPVVIDWRSAVEGPPDLDLAMTAVILAQVATDPAFPLAGPAEAMLAGFLGRAGGDPLSMLDAAVARRRSTPVLTAAEIGRLPAAAALVRRLAVPATRSDA